MSINPNRPFRPDTHSGKTVPPPRFLEARAQVPVVYGHNREVFRDHRSKHRARNTVRKLHLWLYLKGWAPRPNWVL